jgi:hypothetical protein
MIQISDWSAFVNKCLQRIDLLQKLFAVTLEGNHRIYSEVNLENTIGSEPFYCSDVFTGVLVWDTTVGDIRARLMTLQWQLGTIILAEWEAIFEEFLHGLVDTLLAINPSLDPNEIKKDIFHASYRWRSSILNWFTFDITPDGAPIAWTAFREWIEIRNCIIHRNKFVDQIFLDRLVDVKDNLKYPYVIGEEFNVNPGEIFQLLASTGRLLVMLGNEIEQIIQ